MPLQDIIDFVKNTLNVFTPLTWFVIILSVGGAVFLATGNKFLGAFCLLYLLGIISRILCTYSDAIKDVECVSSCGLLMCLVSSVWVGSFFVFTGLWVSKWVSPWGKGEDLAYVLMDSVGMVIAMLFVPLLIKWMSFQIIPIMFWWYVIRFVAYLIMIPFVKPATLVTSFFLTIVGFFIAITQAYIIFRLIGPFMLSSFGITGWSLGTMPILNPIR